MKAKRKNQPRQRRIGLLIHTALFLFGTAFYMVWWATTLPTSSQAFLRLIAFLVTWLVVLLLHTVSVPFFRWARLGQYLWWRPETYRGRHYLLDVHVAAFMATFAALDAWVVSQMLTTNTGSSMRVAFGLMLMLPLWLMGVLVHGHRVLVQDVEASQRAQQQNTSRQFDDVSQADDNTSQVVDENDNELHQSTH